MSSRFVHHHKKPKHNSKSEEPGAGCGGFHDGFVYKIINRQDDNVIQVDWAKKGSKQCRIITDEDEDTNNQRFRSTRMREGENGGQFQVQSALQSPSLPVHIWDFLPHFKILTQNPEHHEGNHLWICEEKSAGSRIYFIKPVSTNLCVTNMGEGEPIALLPPDSQYGRAQHWILEPTDYSM